MVKAPSLPAYRHAPHHPLYLGGKKDVVRVQKADHVATALGIRCVEGGRLSAVALEDSLNLTTKARNHFLGVVLGSVVDNNDFAVAIRLLQRAIDRVRHEPPVVIVVNDDT